MRVTFASYDGSPPLGGQGVMLQGMRRALQEQQVDVDAVTGHGSGAVRFARVLHRAPLDFSLHLNRRPQVLLRQQPDVVHAFGGPGGVLLLRRLSVPLVYTANHTYRQAHPLTSPRRVLGPVEAAAYRRARFVFALSASTAAALRAMRVPGSRIEVLMPGVDIVNVGDVPRDPRRVLFAGRLEPEKGVDDAVSVMRTLLREGVVEQAVVVGEGQLGDAVRAAARDEPRLLVRGAVEDAELREEYARAALVLMPSRYEGLGLVALEAQAAGTPVVGYDVDGLRDAVADDGLLVMSGDRTALLSAARQLLQDPHRREELGHRARERMQREHAWPAVARRLLDVYERVITE
jgi:glycogen(starch) synthase